MVMFRFLSLIFLILAFNLRAQKPVSYSQIDSISYNFYLKNDFKNLRKIINIAQKNQIDFYYLHMRAGIVAYNHHYFEYALKEFRFAQEMNPADPDLQRYLYYTLESLNRTEDAREYANSLPESIQKKIGFNNQDLHSFSLGMIAAVNDNITTNERKNFINPDKKRADVVLNGNLLGLNLVLEKTKNYRLHLYHKLSLFQTHSMGIEQVDVNFQHQEVPYTNIQFQYNFGLLKVTKKGVTFGTGIGFFRTTYSDLLTKQMSNGKVNFTDLVTHYNSILIAGLIGKRFERFYPVLNFHFSNLYGYSQFQAEGLFNFYPLGNSNLFLTSGYSVIKNGQVNQSVFTQKIFAKCSKWCWLEAKYSSGNHLNYMSNLGFLSFNTADAVLQNIGLDIHLYTKKMEFVIGMSHQTRQAIYDVYSASSVFQTIKFNYSNNNLITSVKWNF